MKVCNYYIMWSRPGKKSFHTQRGGFLKCTTERGCRKVCVRESVCVCVFYQLVEKKVPAELAGQPRVTFQLSTLPVSDPLLHTPQHWLRWLHISPKWLSKQFYYYWKWHEDDYLKMLATFPLPHGDTSTGDSFFMSQEEKRLTGSLFVDQGWSILAGLEYNSYLCDCDKVVWCVCLRFLCFTLPFFIQCIKSLEKSFKKHKIREKSEIYISMVCQILSWGCFELLYGLK